MRCVLTNSAVGHIELDSIDPEGLDKITKVLKRSEDNDGVFYEYTLNLKFWADARDWIINVYETAGGIEAIINVSLYKYSDTKYEWRLYYAGKLKLTNYTVDSQTVETSMEQTGFQRKFINAVDQDVKVSDGDGVELPLHSKTLLQMNETRPRDNNEWPNTDGLVFEFGAGGHDWYKDVIQYGEFNLEDQVSTDLPTSHTTTYSMSPMNHQDSFPLGTPAGGSDAQYTEFLTNNRVEIRNPFYVADVGGAVRINAKLSFKFDVLARNDGGDVDIFGSGAMGNVEVFAWLERRTQSGTLVFLDRIGKWNMNRTDGYSTIGSMESKTYTRATNADVGDQFYCFFTVRVWGTYEGPGRLASRGFVFHSYRIKADKANTYLRIESDTVAPESSTTGTMVFEAFKKVAEGITGVPDCFYSEHFGRTDLGYTVDGRGSMRYITNGRSVRGLPVKTLFCNWEELFASFTSLDCLSWGFEIRDGKQVIRVEPKRKFWDPDTLMLELGQVSKLRKRVNNTLYVSTVEIGYPKIETISQVNGVDEFNSVRRFVLPLTQTKNKLQLISPYRASGWELEFQRRLRFAREDENNPGNATRESRLDDMNFLICVIRDGSGFKTEVDENFPVLENVLHPSSIYNASISPARNIRNWRDYLASLLTKQPNKTLTFSYGELNYQFRSRRVDEVTAFGENENVDLTDARPWFVPEVYSFTAVLTDDEMQLIEQNPYGFIQFRDEFNNVKEGYVMRVAHEPNDNKAYFDLLKVYRPQQ